MGIKTYSPYTPSRRQMTGSDFSEITKTTPEKSLPVSYTHLDVYKRQAKIPSAVCTSLPLMASRT